MERTVLLYVLLGIFLSITADQVVSSPEENKPQHSEGAAVNFNHNKPVREGALLQLVDYVNHGDTLLKQRLQDLYSDLKEQLKQGDQLLKERMLEGDAQIKEQLKDGDSRMKDELDEDVAWLTDRISKGHKRLINEISELNQNLYNKYAFQKLKDKGKASSEPSSALIDDLRQQMSDFQAELNSTKQLLQTTRTELDSTRTELNSTKQLLQTTRTELDSTKQLLQTTQTELATNQQTLQSMQGTVQSLTTEKKEDHNSSDSGSTFTRWGRTTCPDNTSLVYSGFAGGTWWNQSGGASNYLCLVMHPQLDNTTAVPPALNTLYGAEYRYIQGHHSENAVCSVCRAPQATTLMIPATLTCPAGWTTQYKGHLVSGYNSHKGRTEYVCLDEVREHHVGGDDKKNGVLFYQVILKCGILPCPPYVQDKVVTCVVCSM